MHSSSAANDSPCFSRGAKGNRLASSRQSRVPVLGMATGLLRSDASFTQCAPRPSNCSVAGDVRRSAHNWHAPAIGTMPVAAIACVFAAAWYDLKSELPANVATWASARAVAHAATTSSSSRGFRASTNIWPHSMTAVKDAVAGKVATAGRICERAASQWEADHRSPGPRRAAAGVSQTLGISEP